MPKYVAYTYGLGVKPSENEGEPGVGLSPGDPVDEKDFEPEDWEYHLEHGNVVVQGGENDPNVLAAPLAGEAYEDPRDARIAELEAALAETQSKSSKSSSDQ